jgi:hypothetical protein
MEQAHNTQTPLAEIPAVAANELSVAMVHGLEGVSADLAAAHPEYRGMTVFGSTVRGETHEGSDADVFVFMEIDPESPAQAAADMLPVTFQYGDSLRGSHMFNGNVGIAYGKTTTAAVKRHGLADNSDLIVLPISAEIIESAAQEALAGAREYEETGVGDAVAPRNIRGLFHPGIDDGQLVRYRQAALRAYAASPHGATAWRMLRHTLGSFENPKTATTAAEFQNIQHRYVPETLDDALAYYNVA